MYLCHHRTVLVVHRDVTNRRVFVPPQPRGRISRNRLQLPVEPQNNIVSGKFGRAQTVQDFDETSHQAMFEIVELEIGLRSGEALGLRVK